ncbi:MAG TPA: MarR family transcriptional regulator [Actinomycetes bacterium]
MRVDAAHTANVVGAFALLLADRMTDEVGAAATQAPSGAAALSALRHFLPADPTVDLVRQVLGLTHSGTVRLVDRLEAAGQVRRGPGPDGRSTTVHLTAAGRRAADRVTAARATVLHDALAVLDPAERRQLDDLAGRVLLGMRRGPGATRWTCRLCDTATCGRLDGRCPVAGPDPPTFSG